MRDSKIYLYFMVLISIVSGLHLTIEPQNVSNWVIRLIGVAWLIESVGYYYEAKSIEDEQ